MGKAVHIAALIILLMLAEAPAFAQDAKKDTGPVVVEVEVCGCEHKDPNRVADVIPIKPGDIYTPEIGKRAVAFLKKWDVFDLSLIHI